MCHVPGVMSKVSCVRCHASGVMWHIFFLQSCGASRCRVCYHWGLTRPVFICLFEICSTICELLQYLSATCRPAFNGHVAVSSLVTDCVDGVSVSHIEGFIGNF